MKVSVTYKNLNKPKPGDSVDNTTLMGIKSQMLNDMSWGSGTSDYTAVKNLLEIEGDASWEQYRPVIKLVSENDPHSFIVEFHKDAFDFESEGVNHFIGTIAGDILLNRQISTLDVDDFDFDCSPDELAKIFPGPNLGIDGVYKRFGNPDRPLLAYSIKPRMGYTPDQFRSIFEAAAKSGVDIIEDDERIVDPIYCSLETRMKIAQEIQNDNVKSLYSANITGPIEKMKKRVDLAYTYNIKFVKVDVMVTGFDALLSLRKYIEEEEHPYPMAITVYPDIIGKYRNLSRNFICKMARLCGADIIYAGSPSWSRNDNFGENLIYECERVFTRHENLRCHNNYLEKIKPTLATMTNDFSAQRAEMITYIFNHCFSSRHHILTEGGIDLNKYYSSKQFAFFIGHGISASSLGISEEIKDIQDRLKKASDANNDDYTIATLPKPEEKTGKKNEKEGKKGEKDDDTEEVKEDFSQYDIKQLTEKYRRGY